MRKALELVTTLSRQIPEARNVRLELFGETLTIQFNVDGKGSRYGLEDADYDRPVANLVAEIVAHHRSDDRAPTDDIRQPAP